MDFVLLEHLVNDLISIVNSIILSIALDYYFLQNKYVK